MAPHTPQRSERPGEPVALLDLTLLWAHLHVGGPDMAPHTPQRSERPGEPVALLDLTLLWAHRRSMSARRRIFRGTVTPRRAAVFRFTARAILSAPSTRRASGRPPRRIFPPKRGGPG